MEINVNVHLNYRFSGPTDLLLQIEIADTIDQRLQFCNLETSDVECFARVAAEDGIGERLWLRTDGELWCDYSARVIIDRTAPDISALPAVAPHLLPGDAVRYLMPSRYCPSNEFQSYVAAEFADLQGGARIAAIRDWINEAFSYVPGSSNAQTTALDSFVQRQGICRDYAHVMIAMARASTIPARFVSVYAPGVSPPDFHAVAEVYLDGTWHLVDPTGMASADSIARIGVGPDAAGVAFLSVFGQATFLNQTVSVTV